MTPRSLRARRVLVLAAFVTATTAATTHAPAATKTWQGADNGNWSLTTNWVGSVLPVAGDDVLMGSLGSGSSLTANLNLSSAALNSLKINANASLTNFTFSQTSATTFTATTETIGDTQSGNTYNQQAGTNTVTSLILGNTAGGAGTYSLGFLGVLNATNVTMGNGGTGWGVFNQTGGTANVSGHFVVGNDASFSNQAIMSGGTLNLTNANADITVSNATGSGLFSQSGGTINAANSSVYVTSGTSSFGGYLLSGTGVLNAKALFVGNTNSGSFTQSGGTATLGSELAVGCGSVGTGSYTLSGASASLTSAIEYIGYSTRGTFTQSAGSHSVTGTLDIGMSSTSTGAYNLTGGTLSVGTSGGTYYGYLVVSDASPNSTFTQTGGTVSAPYGQIVIGQHTGAWGSYNLKGGTVTADALYVGYSNFGPGGSGVVYQSGGTLTVTDTYGGLVVGPYQTEGGQYRLSSYDGPATLNGSVEYVGGGSGDTFFTQDVGTTHNVTGTLYIGAGPGNVAEAYYDMWGGVLNAANITVGNSGNGTFTQSGGTVNISGALNIGVANAAAGSTATYSLDGGVLSPTGNGTINTRPNGTLVMYGGTFTGVLTNNGTLAYHGGAFNGVFDNEPGGSVVLYSPLLAGQGVLNRGTLTLNTGYALGAAGGSIVDNQAVLALAGGSLIGPGAIQNNATLSGWGTIDGSGGFTNNDTLVQGAGTLVIANIGTNTNNASMYLAAGRQLQISSNLTNAGSLAIGSALVTGSGSLTNNASGLLAGPGTVSVAIFSNAGTLLAPAGTTRVTPSFTNAGLIQLNDIAASLTGGTITNSGSIQGAGKIANAVTNTGTITPGANATLTLSGPLTNTGLLLLPATSKLLVTGSFASNAGTITLQGGTLDTNNQPLANNNLIAGYGILSTGGTGLTNNASVTFTGGNTTVTGPVTNAAGKTIEARFNPVLFTGAVVNNGTIKVTGTTVTFAGSYAGNPTSDPSGIDTGVAQDPGFSAPNDGGLTGPGSVVVDPASTLVTSYLRQSSLVATSGTILTRPSAAGGQTSVLSSLTLTGSASLDLADNRFILDLPNAGAVPAATTQLRQYLLSAQVVSSTAAADLQHRLAIGYADNALLGVTAWGGQPVDSTAIVTKMTYLGDANLDGVVNADDYALLDRGFASHSSVWTFGDFNYDGQVNSADYLLIDRVYVQQTGALSPSLLAEREAQFGSDYVQALLTSVPEPSVVGGLFAAAPVLARRRKRA